MWEDLDNAECQRPVSPVGVAVGTRPADYTPEQLNDLVTEVVKIVRSRGRWAEDAEDYVAAALVRWLENPVPLRSPKSWLVVAASRIGIAYWRKRKAESLGGAGQTLADPAGERDRERAELGEEVRAAVRRLPATWRCMVVMEMGGVPRAAIAKRCRCHPNTVRNRLAAAYKRLRARLQ